MQQNQATFPWRLLRTADGKELVEYCDGNVPIVISAPHGGKLDIGGAIPMKECSCPNANPETCIHCGHCPCVVPRQHGTHEEDFWTVELSHAIRAACENVTVHGTLTHDGFTDPGAVNGKEVPLRPFQVIAQAHRKFCDLNRSPDKAYEDPRVAHYYNRFHGGIQDFIAQSRKISPSGTVLLLDLHGQSFMKGHVLRGTLDGRTVTKLVQSRGVDALIGPSSVLGYLHAHGVPVSPHTAPATKANDPDRPEEHKYFNGGNTVNQYGSHKEGGIEAIQIEVGADYRKNDEARQRFAAVLAQAMAAFLKDYLLSPSASS